MLDLELKNNVPEKVFSEVQPYYQPLQEDAGMYANTSKLV